MTYLQIEAIWHNALTYITIFFLSFQAHTLTPGYKRYKPQQHLRNLCLKHTLKSKESSRQPVFNAVETVRCSELLQYGSHTTPRGAFQIFGGDSGDLMFWWLSLGLESGLSSCFVSHNSWDGYGSKCSYSAWGYSMIQWSILPSLWNLNYLNLEPSCNLCLGSHDMYARLELERIFTCTFQIFPGASTATSRAGESRGLEVPYEIRYCRWATRFLYVWMFSTNRMIRIKSSYCKFNNPDFLPQLSWVLK